MFKPFVTLLAAVALISAPAPAIAQSTGETAMSEAIESGYAPVDGAELYYEVHGAGTPLVMLHGGVNPSEMFGAPLAEMAKNFKVVAIHARGHGLSKDTEAPWTVEQAADDVAAVLDELGIGKASVMGYSYGGAIALQFAIRHADMLDKLVVISAAAKTGGNYPEVRAAFDQMPGMAAQIGANIAQSPLAQMYPDVDWEVMMRKTGELNMQPYDWTAGVQQIGAPTLLMFADADSIRTAHMAEFYALLGGGQRDAGMDGSLRSQNQLAIIPNKTHYNILTSPSVTGYATAFLNE